MVKLQVRDTVAAALAAARRAGDLRLEAVPEWTLETPASREHGDYSTDVAMLLARQERLAPPEVAARILKHLPDGGGAIARAEVAGPGFLNFYLAPGWLGGVVREVRRRGAAYGRSDGGAGRRVQVEFVSANPNAPLHVGHGRAAAFGDVLARLLEWTGWQVTRECYVNDATHSAQMLNLGRSLSARYQQLLGRDAPLPEGACEGEYVTELARAVTDREGDRHLALPEAERARVFAEVALAEMLAQQRDELRRFGVAFDVWFSEQTLHRTGAVAEALDALRAAGHAYEAEGILWLRATTLGDDEDHALLRGSSAPTYLAADAAYHRDKFARGFDRVIDIWGPDHRRYVARTRAAVAALGIDPSRLEIIILQGVSILKGGEVVRRSRRAGDLIPLSDLIEEVGPDAARYFLLTRPADTPLDFDVDLARREGRENLLSRVRDAHARACRALNTAAEAGRAAPPADADIELPGEAPERDLVRRLADFPERVAAAAEAREPHRLITFVDELAAALHAFFDTCPPPDGAPSSEPTAARLALVDACRTVLANALALLGVSAPESP
ncbi:MAG: arginine--tRNA ligase [Armatimonadetes bacterium]|nr:arginine--tRNA ligase [Armatimonadota bacterium]